MPKYSPLQQSSIAHFHTRLQSLKITLVFAITCIISSFAFLAVEPEVDVMSPVVYAKQGEAAVLSCVVQGSPLVDVYWTDKDGNRNSTWWKYLIQKIPAGNGIPVIFINMIIRPAIISIHDYGNYTCNAKSNESHVQKAVELKKPGNVQPAATRNQTKSTDSKSRVLITKPEMPT
ncbi:hypothetical protein ACF0H5_013602 [Mactra antiquata]